MYHKQMQQLMSAVVTIQCCSKAVAKKIGISEREMLFVFKLGDGGSYCQTDICQSCFFPKTTVHSMTTDYVNKGYVELISQEGKKEKIIRLTPRGSSFSDSVIREMYTIENQLFGEDDEVKSADFVEHLTHLADHFQKEISQV